jgi:hypothetical protein
MNEAFQVSPLWGHIVLVLVPTASACFAATGLYLAFRQGRKSDTQRRAELVASTLRYFAEDKDIQSAYYALEYGEFNYDADFHGSERERNVDKLLRHFSNTALAWRAGLLEKEDIRPLQYYVLRVLRNPGIKEYLSVIDRLAGESRLGEHPYMALVKLGSELERRNF